MPEGLFGVETSQIATAVLGVGAGFLCLILVLWLIRGRGGPSPFLRGGKNRQPRLQVLDAAAVDTRRRLVLVRRDDVEHLIMIGGPTDVVIESSIIDGRSPPYHTTMKTVSQSEPQAITADEEPPGREPAVRPRDVAAATSKPVSFAQTEKTFEPTPAPAAHKPDLQKAAQPPATASRPVDPAPRSVEKRDNATAAIFPAAIPAVAPQVAPERDAAPTVSLDTPAKQKIEHPEVESPRAANDTPSLDNAANLLDAARERVFQAPRAETSQQAMTQTVEVAKPSAPLVSTPTSVQPIPAPAKPLGSDFERILEEEMASNLASANTAPAIGPATTSPNHSVRRDPNLPRVTGATQEPPLQNEIARIFGEMSVTKDDR